MLQRMKTIGANVNRPSGKKILIIVIEKRTGPRALKTIQWFHFHSSVEHTAGIIETDTSLIPLLLKVFQCFKCVYFNINITKRGK